MQHMILKRGGVRGVRSAASWEQYHSPVSETALGQKVHSPLNECSWPAALHPLLLQLMLHIWDDILKCLQRNMQI